MPPHIRASIAALLGLGLTSGCVHWDTAQAVRTDLARPLASDDPMLSNDRSVFPGPGPGPVPAPGPETPSVDAVRLASAEATVEPPPAPAPSTPTPTSTPTAAPTEAANPAVSIDDDQCRCLAAQATVPVQLIGQELQLVGLTAQRSWCGDPHGFAVHQQVLLYRAEVRRNEAAAAALELFFHIAEAERTYVLLRMAIPEFDQAREEMQTLRRQGLVGSQDTTELDRYRIQLDEQHRLLDESSVLANTQLRSMIGMDPVQGPPIHPVFAEATPAVPVDVDRAIATGLATRADLNLLRMLIRELDPRTLIFALGVLQQVDAGLGVPPAGSHPLSILKAPCDQKTVEARRAQLITLLHDREVARTAEIRRASETLEALVRQAQLAEKTIASWQERIKDLERRIKEGSATPLDITTSRLRLLEARTKRLKLTIEARIAEVRLREAQGIAAAGCCEPGPAPGPLPTPPGFVAASTNANSVATPAVAERRTTATR